MAKETTKAILFYGVWIGPLHEPYVKDFRYTHEREILETLYEGFVGDPTCVSDEDIVIDLPDGFSLQYVKVQGQIEYFLSAIHLRFHGYPAVVDLRALERRRIERAAYSSVMDAVRVLGFSIPEGCPRWFISTYEG